MTNTETSPQTSPLTKDQALQQAIDHHRAGQIQDAERLYRAILQTQPNHPDANHNIGVLAVQLNQPAVGLFHLKTALEANPNQGQYWLSYTDALIKAGQSDVARKVLAQGLQLGLQGEAVEALAAKLAQPDKPKEEMPPELECAIAHRESGHYKEAVKVLQSYLASNPRDASANATLAHVLLLDKQEEQAWIALNAALSIDSNMVIIKRNHARLLLKQQNLDEALQAAQAAYQGDAADPENQLVLAAALGANSQSDQALQLIENALRSRPNYAEAFANRAVLKLGSKDFAGALADAEKALSIKPHLAQIWDMVGSLRYQLKNLSGAIEALEKALDYEPDNAGHMVNLGELKRQAGAVEDAIKLLERAVEITPRNAGAWGNLGAALQAAKRIPEAMAAYAKALEISPQQAEVASNLGVLEKDKGNWEGALRYFEQALKYQPTNVVIMNHRAIALCELGRHVEGVHAALQTIEANPTHRITDEKTVFVNNVKFIQFRQFDEIVCKAMVSALSEPWGRPSDLIRASINLIKLDAHIGGAIARATKAWPLHLSAQDLYESSGLATVEISPLLHTILISAPITDNDMERFLTMARHAMLEAATEKAMSAKDVAASLSFYSALARQCFINEYVFLHTDAEIQQVSDLRDSLITALNTQSHVPVLWPVAVAAYFPLYSLPSASQLLNMQWPEDVMAILKQQVREPKEEQELRATIPRLTEIEDEVSQLVQYQYEENPYPRWIKVVPNSMLGTVNDELRKSFPLIAFQSIDKTGNTDILIAGCGTGLHPIEVAQKYQRTRVLAIDLSISSLCYAKRKTKELGLNSIEYAQADLLKLEALGRSFDVIESSGVLHHLADPWAGWRILLSLLRPGGFMKLGFYSEIARRNIVRIRNYIAEHGYRATSDDIRQCRHDLINLDKSADFGATLSCGDFFSMSACRDLLFHVQEHRMTLTGIAEFLGENNLVFLGFVVQPEVVRAYKLRFPNDRAAVMLDQWQVFENENPDTFVGMYQFWVQKVG